MNQKKKKWKNELELTYINIYKSQKFNFEQNLCYRTLCNVWYRLYNIFKLAKELYIFLEHIYMK